MGYNVFWQIYDGVETTSVSGDREEPTLYEGKEYEFVQPSESYMAVRQHLHARL